MNKEKVINILKSFEYFVDDDWGGYYTNINCSQRATTPLGILKILDYIDDLNEKNTNLKQALNEIRKYCKKINHLYWVEDNEPIYVSEDILQIIDKILGSDE